MEAFEESDLDACAEALEQQRKQFEFEAGLACFFFIYLFMMLFMVFQWFFIVVSLFFMVFLWVLRRFWLDLCSDR